MTAWVAGSYTSNVDAVPSATAADEDTVFGVQRGDRVLCGSLESLGVEAAKLMRLGDALDGQAGGGGAQRQVECARRAR